MRARTVKYSFQQLSDWRDSVYRNLLGSVPGIVYDDLDEANNSVTIGVDRTSTAQAAVLSRLEALGIPRAAVRIQLTSAAKPAGGSASSAIGRDPGYPITGTTPTLEGGYIIFRVEPNSSVHYCSLGLIVDTWDGRGALTASHCSADVYAIDSPAAAFYNQSGLSFGSELLDPLPTSTYWNMPGRGSDVLMIKLNGNHASRRGTIARPNGPAGGPSTDGRHDIDTANPYWNVTETSGPWYGAPVNKVGITTGWTAGTIDVTCADLTVGHWTTPAYNYAIRCANRMFLWAGDGDSGSPVFVENNDGEGDKTVKLLGFMSAIENATNHRSNSSWYTNYNSFLNEIVGWQAQSIIPFSELFLSTPSVNGSVAANNAVLSWSPVSGSTFSTATQYRVTTWQSQTTYDYDLDTYYESTTTPSTTTTTSTSTSSSGFSMLSDCSVFSYPPYTIITHFIVTAWNQGIRSSVSNEVCFQ